MDSKIYFKPIGLNDKNLFDNYFNKFPPNISEFTFTNLFCWRSSKKHEFAEYKGHLIIKSENHLYQPVGENPANIIKELRNYKFETTEFHSSMMGGQSGILCAQKPLNRGILSVKNHLMLVPLSQSCHRSLTVVFDRVEKSIAQNFENEHQRGMDDYVYLVSDLRDLKGTKYQEKRNFIKRFQKYNPSVCIIGKDEINDSLHLAKRWCDVRNCQASPSMHDDDIALKEALVNFEALGLFGICIRINNKIEAIIIGEPLNNDTYLDHFERANTEFTGIYQFLLHEFVKRIPEKFKFLNREQDLGVEGLRRSKMSYHPVKFVEKYKLIL